jgi:hypothetical protein
VVIANSVILSGRSFDTTQRGIGKDNSEEESLWRRVGEGRPGNGAGDAKAEWEGAA